MDKKHVQGGRRMKLFTREELENMPKEQLINLLMVAQVNIYELVTVK